MNYMETGNFFSLGEGRGLIILTAWPHFGGAE